MGVLGVIGKIIAFPFKFIFGSVKKKESTTDEMQSDQSQYTVNQPASQTDASTDNIKAKVDLMLSQIDGLKIEYEAINQRIQNVERMVKELYVMAKS